MYYYRAVDKHGDVIDYYLSEHRDEESEKTFLNKAIRQNGLPRKVIIDGSTSNYAAVGAMNIQLCLNGVFMLSLIEILTVGKAEDASSFELEVH
ncbi:DDE-type integrase/transposase/recombinase [Vibrio sp.]|nr:DDE-type integrase/transposase/recombinase [Vibrio sp.]